MTFDNERVGELQAKYILDTPAGRAEAHQALFASTGSNTDNNAALSRTAKTRALKRRDRARRRSRPSTTRTGRTDWKLLRGTPSAS